MKYYFIVAIIAVLSQVPSAALATEHTITLAVQNMTCPACLFTVKSSLRAVSGVDSVSVSLKTETATVTYDDAKTNMNALIAATTSAVYPSRPKNWRTGHLRLRHQFAHCRSSSSKLARDYGCEPLSA